MTFFETVGKFVVAFLVVGAISLIPIKCSLDYQEDKKEAEALGEIVIVKVKDSAKNKYWIEYFSPEKGLMTMIIYTAGECLVAGDVITVTKDFLNANYTLKSRKINQCPCANCQCAAKEKRTGNAIVCTCGDYCSCNKGISCPSKEK